MNFFNEEKFRSFYVQQLCLSAMMGFLTCCKLHKNQGGLKLASISENVLARCSVTKYKVQFQLLVRFQLFLAPSNTWSFFLLKTFARPF